MGKASGKGNVRIFFGLFPHLAKRSKKKLAEDQKRDLIVY